MQLRIVLAQLSQSVGDLAGNAETMLAVRAAHGQADLIVFPELQLIGYPPEDLALKPLVAERAAGGERASALPPPRIPPP